MRTLDEVIEIASDWTNGFDEMSIEKQMLHYLEEYRSDKLLYEADRKHWDEVISQTVEEYRTAKDKFISKCKELDTGTLNNPLSWDELKQMEGKPVWVEYNLHLSDKDARSRMWIIIQQIFPWKEDDELIYYSGFVFGKKEMGETWQSYRKERK